MNMQRMKAPVCLALLEPCSSPLVSFAQAYSEKYSLMCSVYAFCRVCAA